MMYVLGIDENGLGASLGAFVATGSLFKINSSIRRLDDPLEAFYDPYERVFWEIVEEVFPEFSSGTDSKELMSHIDMKRGEEVVLTFFSLLGGSPPSFFSQFVEVLSVEGFQRLQESCNTSGQKMCWGQKITLPHWRTDIYEKEVKLNAELLRAKLEKAGIRLVDVKSIICCPYNFNNFIEKGGKKSQLNFNLFEELIKYYHSQYGEDILILCDKIGNVKEYRRYFGYLDSFTLTGYNETNPQRSHYQFEHLGEVNFIKYGDKRHFPIALSSIFGKFTREGFVERMNSFFGSKVMNLPHASGYRDSTTEEFRERLEGRLLKLGVREKCFMRVK